LLCLRSADLGAGRLDQLSVLDSGRTRRFTRSAIQTFVHLIHEAGAQ
jgi:hypothetical protein